MLNDHVFEKFVWIPCSRTRKGQEHENKAESLGLWVWGSLADSTFPKNAGGNGCIWKPISQTCPSSYDSFMFLCHNPFVFTLQLLPHHLRCDHAMSCVSKRLQQSPQSCTKCLYIDSPPTLHCKGRLAASQIHCATVVYHESFKLPSIKETTELLEVGCLLAIIPHWASHKCLLVTGLTSTTSVQGVARCPNQVSARPRAGSLDFQDRS